MARSVTVKCFLTREEREDGRQEDVYQEVTVKTPVDLRKFVDENFGSSLYLSYYRENGERINSGGNFGEGSFEIAIKYLEGEKK